MISIELQHNPWKFATFRLPFKLENQHTMNNLQLHDNKKKSKQDSQTS